MSFDELPSLTNTTTTTTVSAEQKVEVKAPIGKSTTKASVDNNGKVTVEEKVDFNTRRGVTVSAGTSRSSDGSKKIGVDASVGNDNTKGKAGVSATKSGKGTTVEVSVSAEQKVGNKKVSATGFIKIND